MHYTTLPGQTNHTTRSFDRSQTSPTFSCLDTNTLILQDLTLQAEETNNTEWRKMVKINTRVDLRMKNRDKREDTFFPVG